MTSGPAGAARLAPLREEIAIFPGPAALDGSPTWTLHDPARNRFYRLGWTEFEIISRWDTGSIETLMQRLRVETTLRVEPEDIEELARFLMGFDLIRSVGPQATANMVKKAQLQRESWARWLLHNYLFMRIPLLRPDRFLTATYPYVRWIYSRNFAIAIIAIGFAGIYLIARQWDTFRATFVDLFSIDGAISFGITLMGLKVVHELGHAYTAKRYGCRVPNMGVALLVMVPVLYTDVNEAWKVTARRHRLAIGLAGVTAELCCAAIAALAWGFLPSGPARSVAFLVATTTWVTTVLLNLSPFMRYDGYYVLSDWLEVPNLHTRAFALARWWLRETLFGLGDAPPEEFPPRRRYFLIAFAFGTWAYRFILFIGIALIIYHFTFKAAGIAMMVVEIGYFVVRPIGGEAFAWWRRRGDMHWSGRTLATAGGLLVLLALLFIPWRSEIEVPAVLKSRQHVDVFVPDFGAQVVSVNVRDGERVKNGALLLRLSSPDIDYRLARARSDIEVTEWQVNARGIDPSLLARSQVSEREYDASLAEYHALLDQKARLDVSAPITGAAVDFSDGLEPGEWLPAKSRLLSVVDPAGLQVDAYIDEADLERIAPGNTATFYAAADDRIEVALRISEIARASTRILHEPSLASVYGGPIAVRATKQNELIPDQTIYRVGLLPAGTAFAPQNVMRGTVVIRGGAVSIASRFWRALLAVAVREGGA
jgi:putative peptide zinc metalloprotease protein